MLSAIAGRPWLTASTSAAALALGMVVFLPDSPLERLKACSAQPQYSRSVLVLDCLQSESD